MSSVEEIVQPARARRAALTPDFGAIDANLDPVRLDPPADAQSNLEPATLPAKVKVAASYDVAAWTGNLVRGRRFARAAVVCFLALTAGLAGLVYSQTSSLADISPAARDAAAGATGTATFDSEPPGAEVVVDGISRGMTPLRLDLPVGGHVVEILSSHGSRTLSVGVEADRITTHYLEFESPATGGEGQVGRLEILSDPPGAQVQMDGVVRGVTPLNLAAVPVGERRIVLTRNGVRLARSVQVAAGSRASMMASMAPVAAGTAAGWLAVRAPFELQIFENGTLLGTTAAQRLMLPAGQHDLELVNEALGFRTKASVSITNGQTATAAVPIPSGTLSVNALPWAEVWVDGRSVGTTPLANLSVPIGSHEVIWRHPQLGERRRTIVVNATAPARVGMDLSQ
jgi:hypothetical protein